MKNIIRSFIILFAAMFVIIGFCSFSIWRFFHYVNEYGGGMPIRLEDGQTVLNNHGEYSPISAETYLKATRLEHEAFIVAMIGILAVGAIIIWQKRLIRKQDGIPKSD